jgi:hypothetical protein
MGFVELGVRQLYRRHLLGVADVEDAVDQHGMVPGLAVDGVEARAPR